MVAVKGVDQLVDHTLYHRGVAQPLANAHEGQRNTVAINYSTSQVKSCPVCEVILCVDVRLCRAATAAAL